MRAKKTVISLRSPFLTNDDIKNLHATTGKTVERELKKVMKRNKRTTLTGKRKTGSRRLEDGFLTAHIDVEFTLTEPGDSQLSAILNGDTKTISQSGRITLSGVQKDDDIVVQGSSLGKINVKIDITAKPQKLDFEPGHFDDFFTIL